MFIFYPTWTFCTTHYIFYYTWFLLYFVCIEICYTYQFVISSKHKQYNRLFIYLYICITLLTSFIILIWCVWPILQGHYCPLGTGLYGENPCPDGTYNQEFGMTDVADCKTCPSGWFCVSGTADPYCDGCVCPKGVYYYS